MPKYKCNANQHYGGRKMKVKDMSVGQRCWMGYCIPSSTGHKPMIGVHEYEVVFPEYSIVSSVFNGVKSKSTNVSEADCYLTDKEAWESVIRDLRKMEDSISELINECLAKQLEKVLTEKDAA